MATTSSSATRGSTTNINSYVRMGALRPPYGLVRSRSRRNREEMEGGKRRKHRPARGGALYSTQPPGERKRVPGWGEGPPVVSFPPIRSTDPPLDEDPSRVMNDTEPRLALTFDDVSIVPGL